PAARAAVAHSAGGWHHLDGHRRRDRWRDHRHDPGALDRTRYGSGGTRRQGRRGAPPLGRLEGKVLRDGTYREIDVEEVVPGDIMRVRAGDIIPADALVIETKAFTAGE